MQMEKPSIMREKLQFLGTFDTIKAAIRIPFRNPSFIAFTFLASLPSFCLMLVHELLVLHTLMETSSQLRQLPPQLDRTPADTTRLMQEISRRYLQLGLLYFIPINLLNLLTAVTTVYSASAIYSGERSMHLRVMLQNSITKTRWKGPLITYIYVSFLSFFSLVVIVIWGVVGPLVASRNVLLLVIYVTVLVIALGKWLEFSALWNMGIVISILEENSGFKALSISTRINKGNRLRGALLMFLHFVWWFSLSFFGVHIGGSFLGRIAYGFIGTGLLCLGKVMKWIVWMVYYHDCKKRQRVNDEVEEGGRDELLFYAEMP